jgi:hypothetical protein
MTETYDITINNITPRWVISADVNQFPQITLHCAAYPDDDHLQVIDEIETFKAIGCDSITSKPLINGGRDIQVTRGRIVPITINGVEWKGAISYPKYVQDDMGDQRIKWDIVIELKLLSSTANDPSKTYKPDFRLYNNINYDCWTEIVVPSNDPAGGEGGTGYTPPVVISPLISTGFRRSVSTQGESVELGTFIFNWDGGGNVYIASAFSGDVQSATIYTDDQLNVVNKSNSYATAINSDNPNRVYDPPLNITSILVEGDNELEITLYDVHGVEIGCSALYFLRDYVPSVVVPPNGGGDPVVTPLSGSVTKLPGTANSESISVGTSSNEEWKIPNNIKVKNDKNYAEFTHQISTSHNMPKLFASNFGFDIPTNMLITRVQVKIGFGCETPDGGGVATIYGDGYSQDINVGILENVAPYTLQTITLDTMGDGMGAGNGLIQEPFPTDASFYNDNSFGVSFKQGTKMFARAWVEYIEVTITYGNTESGGADIDDPSDPNAQGREIGFMTIIEERLVKQVEVVGNACNLPANLSVNGNKLEWHYSHDHNTGDKGVDGLELLTFTISPPATILSFVSSKHTIGGTAEKNSGSLLRSVKVVYV